MLINDQLADDKLLILLSKENELAFKIIYNRYVNHLYKAAISRLKDEALAEDMVQEVFVKLYCARKTMVSVENLKAWLTTCLRNQILNELRNARVHQMHHQAISDQANEPHVSFNNYDLEVYQAQFNKALGQLSERSREVFLMSRQQYLNNKKIADKLQVSVKAVEKHITTALKLMRKELISKMNMLLLVICFLFFF